MSLNKVMLIGNVGKDPEVRYLEGNSANGTNAKVATFPLATSERYKDRNGEQHENTEWHNIVVWRGNADVVERFVKKGTQLYIEGSIRTRQWTDQTGAKRFTTEIVASSLQLLGRREGGDSAEAAAPAARPAQAPAAQSTARPVQAVPQAPAAIPGDMPEGDDLPF